VYNHSKAEVGAARHTNQPSYYIADWNSQLLTYVEEKFAGNSKKATVNVLNMPTPKEFSLHLLLQINEDFDDDLLQEATELLHHDN
jgi:hypothetical protein